LKNEQQKGTQHPLGWKVEVGDAMRSVLAVDERVE
jgi:hypothetical protein